MTENILPFKPRQTDEGELSHEEYLALNKKQALESLAYMKKEIEEGRSVGLLALAFNPPDRDGAGYRMIFNDAIIDYTMQSIGAIEMVKQRITQIRDAEYGDAEPEPVPVPVIDEPDKTE